MFDFEFFEYDFDNPVAVANKIKIVVNRASRNQLRIGFAHKRRRFSFEHFCYSLGGQIFAFDLDVEQDNRQPCIGELGGDT